MSPVYSNYIWTNDIGFLNNSSDCAYFVTGQRLQHVEIPSASRITSCCFGGKNLDELYVTSSAYEVSSEEFEKYPLSGSVFRVTDLGVRGRKAHIYEGWTDPPRDVNVTFSLLHILTTKTDEDRKWMLKLWIKL